MPNAVHLPDWCHLTSNGLCLALNNVPSWPAKLDALRSVIDFLKIQDYRNAFQDFLLEERQSEHAKLLTSFHGSFARWRYNTVADALAAVVKVRPVCERYACKSIWGEVQDASRLASFLRVCADAHFWRRVAVFERAAR